ncbi:MAG: hypothetical protein PHP00_00870 [Thiotrichaceae bacterium]|nr:hypothetical protein [Thiotrichaceae bacterium]
MIASPYSIPISRKTPEATGTPYYVPTAATTNKTRSATRDNSGSTRSMSITREEPQSSQPAQTSSTLESSNTSSNNSSSNSSTVIYVPVSSTATAVSTQPFGVPLVPAKTVTPTFSVGMKNDKHK